MKKIPNVEKWGLKTAEERYKQVSAKGHVDPVKTEQPPQFPEDKHDEGLRYSNDAEGWVRGAVGKPTGDNGTAENKPGGFDKGNAWRKGRGL